MVTMWMLLDSMSHSALHLKEGAVLTGLSKVEAKNLGSQSSVPAAASLRKQLHGRKSFCGTGNARVQISCNPRGQSSVVDAEPVADNSGWRVEAAILTSSGEELAGWQKVKGVTVQSMIPTPVASSKNVFHREFSDTLQDIREVVLVEEIPVERSSDEFVRSEAGSLEASSCIDDDSATSSKHILERRKNRKSASRPDKVTWRLYVEGVRSPLMERSASANIGRISQQLQDVMMFLESLGLDSDKVLTDNPLLSTCSIENVREVVRFLEQFKLRRRDVVRLLTNNPQLLGHTVEEKFQPVLEFLRTEVGLMEKDVGKVVNRCARLLTLSVDDRLRPTLLFLQSLGFTHMPIVVSNNATLLASRVESRLVPKIKFLEGLGLSNEETLQVLIRFPAIFNYSVDKNLQPKYNYLVEDMGRGLDDLKAFPQYFGYSLEFRIRPRYQFLKKRNLFLPLADILKPTDEVFFARFQHDNMRPFKTSDKIPSCVG